MKALPKDISAKYEVVLVSPRNYFLYTPLLPAVATGTMEERSIVEPIRSVTTGKGEFYEAVCESIDPVKKHITACFPKDAGFAEACFRMDYDHLVVSVGSVNNTFGVKGVEENCFFFKSITDASRLRRQISECFERAALPYTPDSVRLPYHSVASFHVLMCVFHVPFASELAVATNSKKNHIKQPNSQRHLSTTLYMSSAPALYM